MEWPRRRRPSGRRPAVGAEFVAAVQPAPAGACMALRAPDPEPAADEPALHDRRRSPTTVHGSEQIVFRPDRPITELVFRLTANTRPTVAEGNKITVTPRHRRPRRRPLPVHRRPTPTRRTQGGLLHIPFPPPSRPARRVTRRSSPSPDARGRVLRPVRPRRARSPTSGRPQPLLAWERGYGWHTEDLIHFTAESATSEAMDVDLTVTAPAADIVIMSGDPADPAPSAGATRTWHSTIAAARDVSVAAGPFSVVGHRRCSGVQLRLGAPRRRRRATQLVPGVPPRHHRAGRPLRAVPVPVAVGGPAAGAGRRHRVPELDPDARRVAAGRGARDRAPVVLRDGRRLAGAAPVAGRGLRRVRRAARQRRPAPRRRARRRRAPWTRPPSRTADDATATTSRPTTRARPRCTPPGSAAGAASWDAALRCYVAAQRLAHRQPGRPAARDRRRCRPRWPCCGRAGALKYSVGDPARGCHAGGQPSATSLAMRPTPSARSSSPSA